MRRTQAGVTLIELLIVVTLVALLAVGMLFAMRIGLTAMERSNAKLMANRKAVSAQKILEQQVAGIMPVKADCGGNGDQTGTRVAFFQGEPASMRFVSSYSLHEGARGYPTILEFHVVPGENDTGVRLIVNESTYSGPVSAGAACVGFDPAGGPQFRPIQTGPGSFVLLDKLSYCRFAFREPPQPPATEGGSWVVHWTRNVLPAAIRIDMAPLTVDASALQPLALTMPIRVNRLPMENYDF
jgi:prepilin-type N-terminal cleavage/methylation domain-containing protein